VQRLGLAAADSRERRLMADLPSVVSPSPFPKTVERDLMTSQKVQGKKAFPARSHRGRAPLREIRVATNPLLGPVARDNVSWIARFAPATEEEDDRWRARGFAAGHLRAANQAVRLGRGGALATGTSSCPRP
jgi:hypothetical protein